MPKRSKHTKAPKLTKRQYAQALFKVAQVTYKAAPLAVIMQIAGSLITAVLPIVTTYFAARTTTALADAYAGTEGAATQVFEFVAITAALGVTLTAWNSLESYITTVMKYKVEATMSDRMYEHFHAIDFWHYDNKDTADMYEKAQQFSRFFPYVFDNLSRIITQFLSMVAGLVALMILSWWLGLIALVAIIPGIYLQLKLSRAQTLHWSNNVETRRKQNMIEWQVLQPRFMAELRLYGVVRHLLTMRMQLRDKDEQTRIEFERSYIGKKLFADTLEAAAEVAALVWAAVQIINRQQPIGQFLFVQQIVSRAISGASQLVGSISSIDQDIANLFDYQRFMDLPEQSTDTIPLTQQPDVVRVEKVSFHYPQVDTMVLEEVSMTIHRGQHVAIVGENGAGKSSLIKLLTGLYQPTSGEIYLDDVKLRDIATSSWHKYLGVLQQNYISYGFATARDNVYYGDTSHPYDDERYNAAVTAAEAKKFIDKLPRGADSFVDPWIEDVDGNSGIDLSGGQWQRLALARNFYRNSPIIILDEPTSAIDALAESRIFKHLFANRDRTIITISHRLTTVMQADIVYMLKDGRLVEQGTAAELIEKNGEFARMFESQIK